MGREGFLAASFNTAGETTSITSRGNRHQCVVNMPTFSSRQPGGLSEVADHISLPAVPGARAQHLTCSSARQLPADAPHGEDRSPRETLPAPPTNTDTQSWRFRGGDPEMRASAPHAAGPQTPDWPPPPSGGTALTPAQLSPAPAPTGGQRPRWPVTGRVCTAPAAHAGHSPPCQTQRWRGRQPPHALR